MLALVSNIYTTLNYPASFFVNFCEKFYIYLTMLNVLQEMTATVASLDSSGSVAEQGRAPSSVGSGHSRDLLDLEPPSQVDGINTVQHALRVSNRQASNLFRIGQIEGSVTQRRNSIFNHFEKKWYIKMCH